MLTKQNSLYPLNMLEKQKEEVQNFKVSLWTFSTACVCFTIYIIIANDINFKKGCLKTFIHSCDVIFAFRCPDFFCWSFSLIQEEKILLICFFFMQNFAIIHPHTTWNFPSKSIFVYLWRRLRISMRMAAVQTVWEGGLESVTSDL